MVTGTHINICMLPSNIRYFIAAECYKARLSNIKVHLENVEFGKIGGMDISGYFDEEVIYTATKKPLEKWLGVFGHETCHMDQFIEKDPVYQACKLHDMDICGLVDLWYMNLIEFTDEQRERYIMNVIRLEHDCEKRMVEKIRKWQLPLDIDTYIRDANTYLYFIAYTGRVREWDYNKRLCANPFVGNQFLEPEAYLQIPENILQSYQ